MLAGVKTNLTSVHLRRCEVSDSASSTLTTSSATSTYAYSCNAECAACTGGMANRALATPTATPSPPILSNEKRNIVAQAQASALFERDIPSRSSGGTAAEFYGDDVENNAYTIEVPQDHVGFQHFSTSVYQPFVNAERNVYVSHLRGCTSVVVVSRRGAWVSHFWEPTFANDRSNPNGFQTGVLDYLENGRTGEAGTQPLLDVTQSSIFGDSATTKIFIMTPATYDHDLKEYIPEQKDENGNIVVPEQLATPEIEQTASLQQSDDQPLFDGATDLVPDRLTPLKDQLREILPGVEISQFTYRRQQSDERVQNQAYGKMVVSTRLSKFRLLRRR